LHGVSGAGRGVGRAIALELARAGARIAVGDVRRVDLGERAEALRCTCGRTTASSRPPVRAERLVVDERSAGPRGGVSQDTFQFPGRGGQLSGGVPSRLTAP
jgi:NAD(P)-dependent dehydrogenase (short-subunit alcohol dehydrogenase family)